MHHGVRTGPNSAQFVVKIQISFGTKEVMYIYNKVSSWTFIISSSNLIRNVFIFIGLGE